MSRTEDARSPLPAAGELAALCALAERAARRGGAALLEWAERLPARRADSKGARRELVTGADRAAERAVVGALLEARPADAVLAEEGELTPAGAPSRDAEWLWIVDPLDGTTNFVHRLPYFAVAVAAAWRGEPVVGVVHAPRLGVTYVAARGLGATRDGSPIGVADTAELGDALLATGFSYVRDQPGRDDNVERLRAVLPHCRDLRRYGSAELDLCLTADGTYDGYWELDLAPYDVAAGAVVVAEAGGRVTDLRGGGDWLYGGSILASNRRLHDALLAHVGDRASAR
ncbi:MAG: inositol monophosphatase [Planctomycetes bacterium]|nr:inositol monophosphatase [Planctomycetota bacterium]